MNTGVAMQARVHVTLKNGVLDPQGQAIHAALGHLGFSAVKDVRQGRYIVLDLDETDRARAEMAVRAMCEKLLANTVIENFQIELVG
jgi:phosphoribosylformylglycinamidine synthase